MHNWFKCTVSYETDAENGMKKKVKEEYLVDAFSYTECEARIIEEMRPFISGEFGVDIKRFRIAELFAMDGDRFYKVTADYITIDEKSSNEKRKAFNYIVQVMTLIMPKEFRGRHERPYQISLSLVSRKRRN